jgi:hypothetical protein
VLQRAVEEWQTGWERHLQKQIRHIKEWSVGGWKKDQMERMKALFFPFYFIHFAPFCEFSL